MRFFIIVDGKSRVSATRVWEVLKAHLGREEFEVLPIPGSQFRECGQQPEQLFTRAHKEAARVLERYQDVSFCVVVFHTPRRESAEGTKVIPSDCAYVLYRDQKKDGIILNDKIDSEHRIASSPKLQPELTDALIEYTLIDLVHKY